MLGSTLRKLLDDIAVAERNGKPRGRYDFNARNRERVQTLIAGGFLETRGDNGIQLAITRKGEDARRPPLKKLRMIGWKTEPRGPGTAERLWLDLEGERFELLAYTFLASSTPRRLCSGFEIFGRDYRGRFFDQVAAGEAQSLAEAKAAAEAMAKLPREQWRIEVRSWVSQ